ncbi:peptide/nickel transport system permease protein [Pseudonocardia thermophila]|jgi:ABC-type dipeptide/oligopeptide/nickel transport systems, permease components|uniref:Peptide/nickel transport system permease protein n=1 Tax=Pseudonocardia thermophila TaxID=1848 RepID=A0A1M6Q9D4_PSETH|nr:ABC transporter permease [Pseudonocardia thermophila]SHK16862.1 peptide/nickel transport system permease protein [Pseudonocardia thermophila]
MTVLARSSSVALGRLPRPGTVLAGGFVALVVLAAVAPGLLTSDTPTQIDLTNALAPPSWEHPFGTDEAGRDLLTRVIHGTGLSLGIGLGATGVSMALAIVLGAAAALAGGVVDTLITRLLEVTFAFPSLLAALLIVAVFGPSVTTSIVAVGVGSMPGYARMVRGQVLAVKESGYIEAAHALGHRPWRVFRQHLLPNAMRPLVAVVTLGVGQSIVWASSLAFLGLGVPPPSPEWGALLDAGRGYITTSWWLAIMPGLVIVLFAVAVTSLGRTLQQRLEGAAR